MKLQEAIESIWDCKQQGIYYPAEWRGQLDVDSGYRVQLGILAKEVKAGERHVGWKVGLTAKAIQEQVDFHERVFGYLLASGERPSAATIPFDELVGPSFENELLVVLGTPLKGPDVTPEQAAAAIVGVAPAFELVEKRGDFAADAPLSLADNVQQRAFVVGPLTSPLPPGTDLRETSVEIYINGEQRDAATAAEVMGGPAASVAWLANRLADYGQRLDKGAKILTGSLTRQYPIAKGDLIEARFAPWGSVLAEFA
ncbi:MAG TPA: fumarylacetoacetate hydrolase family protein [bacterium]|nr:fumarylacetoacetate hydrolase family protein [bacterium]